MKILLIGYGKMGKAIEKIALSRGHEIAGRIDIGDTTVLPLADVAIEFTQPDSAVGNINRCLEAGMPVVCGTTGWLAHRSQVESLCREKDGTFFYSSNFSLGVQLFFHLNEYLARIMARYPDYSASIDETHHTQKKDAPSGTAITLAEGILRNNPHLKGWSMQPVETGDHLLVRSFRVDPAPGTHAVRYRSGIDDLEITHTAHSRDGFATGAVLVAEWLRQKKGVYTMTDFLKF